MVVGIWDFVGLWDLEVGISKQPPSVAARGLLCDFGLRTTGKGPMYEWKGEEEYREDIQCADREGA